MARRPLVLDEFDMNPAASVCGEHMGPLELGRDETRPSVEIVDASMTPV
jgi:hypothetical protein